MSNKKREVNDFEQSIVLSATCIPMAQVFILIVGNMPTVLALFFIWCPVIWQMSAVFFAIRFLKNNLGKKTKAWGCLIFAVAVLMFVGFFCTCNYDMGYVTFWMIQKRHQTTGQPHQSRCGCPALYPLSNYC